MGYILTVEAPDASGKSTQVTALCKHLEEDGYTVRLVRFPNYGTDACKPAELYLNGALGKDPNATNAYAASVLFAVDRYFSYKTDWEAFVKKPGTVLLLDRYTTSNAIHQLSKIPEEEKRTAFLDWLYDFEFGKLQLPVPDDTLFLDVPPLVSASLMKARAQRDKSHNTDIHEASPDYLAACYDAAIFAAGRKNWHRIICTANGKMRPVDDIHREIYEYVLRRIREKNAQ